jgi:hypothetical protein
MARLQAVTVAANVAALLTGAGPDQAKRFNLRRARHPAGYPCPTWAPDMGGRTVLVRKGRALASGTWPLRLRHRLDRSYLRRYRPAAKSPTQAACSSVRSLAISARRSATAPSEPEPPGRFGDRRSAHQATPAADQALVAHLLASTKPLVSSQPASRGRRAGGGRTIQAIRHVVGGFVCLVERDPPVSGRTCAAPGPALLAPCS